MARIIILLAVIALGLVLWYKISNAPADKRKNLIFWSTAGVIIGTLVVLAATGRMHWLYALGGSIAAFTPRLISALRYLPLINRFRQQYTQQKTQSSGQQAAGRANPGQMTADQAREILGVKANASREEIIKAHKRMMQKVHPDRGGSDYLAAQINQAKDTLLG
ncbi:MAG: DnaJ domain-containing protein [Thiotrichales bacterium]|nr:MAG: DnaJ domain-containing protein [Thiotrichales bacterium]